MHNTDKSQTDHNTDAIIIMRVLGGDAYAFKMLSERHVENVLRMVARLMPLQEDAEDTVQDTMIEAFLSLKKYDPRKSSFRTWLMSIAYHIALKRIRTQGKIETVDIDQNWLTTIPDEETDEILNNISPHRLELLNDAVAQLKTEDQILLSFYYYYNHPIREISFITGKSEDYLRSRLQWIRKRLAIIIKTMEHDGHHR